ncbi:hypothetical protein ArV2_gp67 [Arthrobacter phage vB_ArS-ArV2]|uniref:Uncharacterized protein n=1 Tax=Arthrobacter phage vB_ArS-ArV2 TaxID=1414742 RepID=V5RA93_9CAUD|nr:hypothetical protein ArV2_gp67 [Arthrobacter phage vB_ArS-ArV2]AHB31610.1 hypothetical protein ArV2_gp67 [Arthrobacter phage vB_ArS-ArV2]
MGLKDWLVSAPIATHGKYVLTREKVEKIGEGSHSLAGVTALVESGEALSQRVTLTRFAAFGLLSLAVKKKRGGESWLLIEGPDFAWTEEVKRGDQVKAQKFAAAVRAAAAKV